MMRDASTEENARHHWQNTQRYSFHNFSPGPQFDEPGPPPPPRNNLNIRAPRQTTGRSSATLWEGNDRRRKGHVPVASKRGTLCALRCDSCASGCQYQADGGFHSLVSRLRFPAVALLWFHANLRISLRTMREGQRDSDSFERLEGHPMSQVRLDESRKEILHLRVSKCRRQRAGGAETRRRWWMRAGVRVSLRAG
jgi:hypothetical protein